jgi:hypothetical protein
MVMKVPKSQYSDLADGVKNRLQNSVLFYHSLSEMSEEFDHWFSFKPRLPLP